ncbi:hypothetical protein [Mongoliitalea daihaiensis]|uniref:hypothetical protein n=1 Tax=Mongoliitalea daihaiensis TaxID=2782006 RepID=UPI001F323DDD|nr:hypothetical protein [Mongoliitalea daihaiensis]UJP65831.1 hypothetical protein IPZ59_04185 [Mongoliitalea daihaiensis]
MKRMILFTASLLLSSQLLFASSHEGEKTVKFEDLLRDFKIEVLENAPKKAPSIVFINKCGDVVGELYGDKTELNEKFQALIKEGHLMTTSETMEVYLIK